MSVRELFAYNNYSLNAYNLEVSHNLTVDGNVNINGQIIYTSTIDSTSVTTGAIVVRGGMGIEGAVNIGEDIMAEEVSVIATYDATDTDSGSLLVIGGASIGKSLYATTVNTSNFQMGSQAITSISTDQNFTSATNYELSTSQAIKNYIQNVVMSISWQEPILNFFNPTSGLPTSPNNGDRYISSATANGWTINEIYTYDSTLWVGEIPTNGFAVYNESNDTTYVFNGSNWVRIGVTISYLDLSNLLYLPSVLKSADVTTLSGMTTGERILQSVTDGSYVANNIYQYNGTSWTLSDVASDSIAFLNQTNGTFYIYNGLSNSYDIFSVNPNPLPTGGTTGSILLNSGTGSGVWSHNVIINDTSTSTGTSTGTLFVNGGVGIGGPLQINTTTNTPTPFQITSSGSGVPSGPTYISSYIKSTMAQWEDLYLTIGQAVSNYNSAMFGFQYDASGNVANNTLVLGVYPSPSVYLNSTICQFTSPVTILNTNDTTSASTGALVVNGGVGMVHCSSYYYCLQNGTNNWQAMKTDSNGIVYLIARDSSGKIQMSNVVAVTNTTDSSNASTGSLIVAGGVGMSKNLSVGGGTISIANGIYSDSLACDTSGNLNISAPSGSGVSFSSNNVITINNGTVSGSPNTGALCVTGGIGTQNIVNSYGETIHHVSNPSLYSALTCDVNGYLRSSTTLNVADGIYISGTQAYMNGGTFNFNNATVSSSPLNGTLTIGTTTNGGLGVTGNVNSGSNVSSYGANISGKIQSNNSTSLLNWFVALDFSKSVTQQLYGPGMFYHGNLGGSITGNKLKLTTSTNYVNWTTVSTFPTSVSVLSFRCHFTPNWSGNPSSPVGIFSIGYPGVNTSLISFSITTGGIPTLFISSGSTAVISFGPFNQYVPVAGVEDEFLLNIDLAGGVEQLFINGVLNGGFFQGTGYNMVNMTYLQIGTDLYNSYVSNYYIRDVVFYSAPPYTSGYTSSYFGGILANSINVDGYLNLAGNLLLPNGSAINGFSTDGTMSAHSTTLVPTQSAVVSYVGSQIGNYTSATVTGNWGGCISSVAGSVYLLLIGNRLTVSIRGPDTISGYALGGFFRNTTSSSVMTFSGTIPSGFTSPSGIISGFITGGNGNFFAQTTAIVYISSSGVLAIGVPQSGGPSPGPFSSSSQIQWAGGAECAMFIA